MPEICPYETSRLSVWYVRWRGRIRYMNPAISGLVTAPAFVAMRKNLLSQVDLETSRKIYIFFRIEILLLTIGTIMGHWASVPDIWRGKGRNYVVALEGYRCIYVTAVYPELILYGVLKLSRKISA